MTDPKINAKQAAQNAVDYYKEITGYSGSVTIEEIELSDTGTVWLITVGYRKSTPAAAGIYGFPDQEQIAYKVFEISSENGEVLSMKIRSN